MSRFQAAICALAVVGLLAAFDAPHANAVEGTIEVRLTDHADGIGAFASLAVGLAEVALHRRGASRREGWAIVAENTTPVDIVPLKDGKWASIARKHLEAGAYDAVRVRFATLTGRFHEGRQHPVVGHDGAIAASLTVPADGSRAILLDLYVEDQTEHAPPRFVVKVRRAEGQEG